MNTNTQTEIRNVSEARIQSDCFIWAYNTYPQIRGLLFSVPNGGTRNIREAQTLRATGLTPGVPDLLLLYRGIHAFEFKSEKGILSPVQEKIHAIWLKNGIKVYVIKNQFDFMCIVNELLN